MVRTVRAIVMTCVVVPVIVVAGSASARAVAHRADTVTPPVLVKRDRAGDSKAAPDITSVTMSSTAAGQLYFVVQLTSDDSGSNVEGVDIDTDRNTKTGDPHNLGADYWLSLDSKTNRYGLSRWSRGAWRLLPAAQRRSARVTRGNDSLSFTVNIRELGNTHSFDFFIGTYHVPSSAGVDWAPNYGAWVYTLPADPTPDIDLSSAALETGDFSSNAVIAKQRSVNNPTPGVVSDYDRQFREGAIVDGATLQIVDNELTEYQTPTEVTAAENAARAELKTDAGRDDLFSSRFSATSFRLLSSRSLGIGDTSSVSALSFDDAQGHETFYVLSVQLDAISDDLTIEAAPGATIPQSALAQLAATGLAHLRAASGTVSTAPMALNAPTITGSSAQGSTLSANQGTWSGTPDQYSFQWQRCDATGANCVAIAGATTSTYVVTPTDVGSTLRVTVTATNVAGSATAQSAPTAAVI